MFASPSASLCISSKRILQMFTSLPGTFPPRQGDQPVDTSSHVGGTRGSSSTTLAEYSFSMGKLNSINNRLDAIGVEGVLQSLKLPRIIVMGNQGSGKSSLIEAIAKISLPQAKGTTTRCPMEIILKTEAHEGPKYRVALKVKYQPDGTPLVNSKSDEFASTNSPDELRRIINCAQLAILNPTKGKEEFLALEEQQCESYQSRLTFSKNIVVVEVAGAESDITLYDLPGIISHVEKKEDKKYIEMVQELAIEYAKPAESLILVTVSMAEELNTQAALTIAQDCDPTESRTTVVLTKVDRVQESETKYWLKLLKKDEKIGKYFLTILVRLKNWKDGQGEWTVLVNAPWSDIKSTQKGIKNLIQTISKRLADSIQKMLPTVWELIDREISISEEALSSLPRSFSDNPQLRLLELCDDFKKRVAECTIGRGQSNNFIDDCLCEKYKELADEIMATCPDFQIPEPPNASSNPESLKPRRHQSPVLKSYPSTPASSSSDEAESDISDTLEHPQGKEVIPLQKVREVIEMKSKRQLPGQIDTTALVPEFTIQRVSEWEKLCLEAFRTVHRELKKHMEHLCEEYFGRFKGSGLLGAVKDIVRAQMQDAADATRKQVELICRFEKSRPITQNSDRFLSSKEEHMTNFLYDRTGFHEHNLRASFMIQDPVTRRRRYLSHEQLSQHAFLNQVMSDLTAQGIQVTNPKQLARLQPRDEYETEIHLISAVLAYFEIASMRVIEVMPMIFEVVYLEGFEEGLRRRLTEKLKLMDGRDGQEICERYATENDEAEEKRRTLDRKRMVLREAMVILRSLE